jgi:hypothetical protein
LCFHLWDQQQKKYGYWLTILKERMCKVDSIEYFQEEKKEQNIKSRELVCLNSKIKMLEEKRMASLQRIQNACRL